MKCYSHPNTDAVAICKNCSKGLCRECLVELENGIACKGACEKEVKDINEIMARGKTAYQKTAQAYKRNAIIYTLMGSIFALAGIIAFFSDEKAVSIVLIPIGLIFMLGALFSNSTGKKLNKV
jgi:hypothetical protein